MSTIHQPERTIGGVTNAERAKSGGRALAQFAKTQYGYGEDIETVMTDLMCNLMHFAASMGVSDPLDFVMDAVTTGEGHYRAEATDEPHEGEDGELASEPPFATDPACDPSEWMKYYGEGSE